MIGNDTVLVPLAFSTAIIGQNCPRERESEV